jgi:DNA-binding NarL/FixJ family response regulator
MVTEARKRDIPTAPQPQLFGRLPTHVLLVDDHPAVRHGIRQLISDQPDMVTIAERGRASPETIAIARWADVAVIDYHLGDRDGLWLTRQIKQRPSPPPVLIYSAFADTALVIAAIVAGADGLLSKTTLADELTIAIRRLAHGRQYFPAIPRSISDALCSRLQAGDQTIFSMLIHGVPPAEINSRLELSAGELEARRQLILGVIAPKAARASLPDGTRSPLDYERPRRRQRYRAPG